MIAEKTLLILGSGASIDYGYPTGKQLKNDIIERSHFASISNWSRHLEDNTVLIDDTQRLAYLLKRGYSPELITNFSNSLRLSARYSIDSFLENRPEFLDIGKDLIAYCLFKYENPNKFYSRTDQNWYQYLFNIVAPKWDALDNSNLTIATYNYDRSLEYYFTHSLINTYGKTFEEAEDKLGKIPIIHMHGQLAEYSAKSVFKEYEQNVRSGHLKRATKILHIIFEEEKVKQNYVQLHKLILEAERVFILGFGFDEVNLSRLNFANYSKKKIYSTRYGITDLELQRINMLTNNAITFGQSSTHSILQFFQNDVSLHGIESKGIYDYNKSIRHPKPFGIYVS